jgi:ubiquinone/menaquinone biosynthesis C-methylase UbiE
MTVLEPAKRNNFVNHLRAYQFASQFTAGKSVLDVGCGIGYGVNYLSRAASRIVGIDLSCSALREAYRLYPDMEFCQMDAINPEFPDRSFDVIFSSENF